MPLNIEQKKEVVKELNIFAAESVSGAIAEYSGLSVSDLTHLRNKARESGVYLKVVKNTLSKRAFEETDFKCLIDDLNGPIIIASCIILAILHAAVSNFGQQIVCVFKSCYATVGHQKLRLVCFFL